MSSQVLSGCIVRAVIQLEDAGYGPLAIKARLRPSNYLTLSPEAQWEIDKQLGILDWDGDPKK